MLLHYVSSDVAALNWLKEHHKRISSDKHWLCEIWKKVSNYRKAASSRQSGECRNALRHLSNFKDFNFAEVWITQPTNGLSVATINLSNAKHCSNDEKVLKSRDESRNNFCDKLLAHFCDL